MAEERQKGILKEQKLLRATNDRKVWRAMITHYLKGHKRRNQTNIVFQSEFFDKDKY